jgi:hypothetical protein
MRKANALQRALDLFCVHYLSDEREQAHPRSG